MFAFDIASSDEGPFSKIRARVGSTFVGLRLQEAVSDIVNDRDRKPSLRGRGFEDGERRDREGVGVGSNCCDGFERKLARAGGGEVVQGSQLVLNGNCLIGCEGSVELIVCIGQGKLRDYSNELDLIATLLHHKAMGVARVEDTPEANDPDGLGAHVSHLGRETEVIDVFNRLAFGVGQGD